VRALLDGRGFVLPDDVQAFARPALAHRLILDPSLWMKSGAANDIINGVLQAVPVPVAGGAG